MEDSTSHQIKIDLPGLLQLLGTNIYSDPAMCIREMIQNAHDSCIHRGHRMSKENIPLRIDIRYNKIDKTLEFEDNGAGMNERELHEYLATIGKGYTGELRKLIEKSDVKAAHKLIGQFGIGLLSAFSIAERVDIFTKSYKEGSKGLQWTCCGDVNYNVSEVRKHNAGTRVVIKVVDKHLDLLDGEYLSAAIKRYADFLSIPIYLNDDPSPVNTINPPWHTNGTIEDYIDYVERRYLIPPIDIIPIVIDDEPVVDIDGREVTRISIYGVLYVPMVPMMYVRDYGDVDIYISRMFVKEGDTNLLPRWAKFIRGVIDSPSLTPTVSRNDVIIDQAYFIVQDRLGKMIKNRFRNLKAVEPKRLEAIVTNYNNVIKAWAVEDDDFFNCVSDLVRVKVGSEYIPMSQYLSKIDNSDPIFYFSEAGSGTQHSVLFGAKKLPVIDASWGSEERFLEKFAEKKGRRLSKAESDEIFEQIEDPDGRWRMLEVQYNRLLKIEAKVVEFMPEDVPAVLVSKKVDRFEKALESFLATPIMSSGIKKAFADLRSERQARKKGERKGSILHLNSINPLIQKLREMNHSSEIFRLTLTVIYNNALLFARHTVTPEEAKAIFNVNNEVISRMIYSTFNADEVQRKLSVIEQKHKNAINEIEEKFKQKMEESGLVSLNEYRSCFYARQFSEEFADVQKHVEQIMSIPKYGIEVISCDVHINDFTIFDNVLKQMTPCHFAIADITGGRPNVMAEMGMIIGAGKPVILLRDGDDNTPIASNFGNHLYVEYKWVSVGTRKQLAIDEESLKEFIDLMFDRAQGLKEAKPVVK